MLLNIVKIGLHENSQPNLDPRSMYLNPNIYDYSNYLLVRLQGILVVQGYYA